MKDQRRKEMKRAVRYRSGPGAMNTVYLGGLATCKLMSLLGGRYGDKGNKGDLQWLIDNATDAQFEEAWNYKGFKWILEAYRKAGSKLYSYETIAVEID